MHLVRSKKRRVVAISTSVRGPRDDECYNKRDCPTVSLSVKLKEHSCRWVRQRDITSHSFATDGGIEQDKSTLSRYISVVVPVKTFSVHNTLNQEYDHGK